jgi:hypothetical protein
VKRDADARKRLQIVCSPQQLEMIDRIAISAGADRTTWALAQVMRAVAKHDPDAKADRVPLVIEGAAADRLRGYASRQGIGVAAALDQLLLALAEG